ncbi:P-loop containing nucleoside triphosphate hydrolase protein [Geopyxis carbonaria]|nr:P-loop containing nucleoside triphosphate hydrolase protein [Geopyxis carbonaria]
MDTMISRCNSHESTLLKAGLVDTKNTGANYSDIYLDPSIIEKIERVTSLSLSRPDAFTYGILSESKITGALLYGPPGTGKSALARSVAKQSGYAMVQVSSADVFQNAWGEDDKVIRAIFSLGRKLHPCIIFIDEADGIFSSRESGERKHVRTMLNTFLQEWDGICNALDSPFILLATNRPFDLDPAVLRRAPVHIHIDIPSKLAREQILKVQLRGEQLAEDVKFSVLANMTQQYTGSDLKTLCVTAALACVHEEQRNPDTGEFPKKRILRSKHFGIALKSVRPTMLPRATLLKLEEFHKRSS